MPPILCYVTHRQQWPGWQAETEARRRESQLAAVKTTVLRVATLVDWIQVREKDLSGRELALLVEQVVATAARSQVFVNDRFDIAVAARAAGVHLGGESVPVRAVARWRAAHGMEGKFQIGRSCHSLEEAERAAEDGADYLFFGPVFETPEKIKFGPPQGTEKLAAVCRAVQPPVLAIGGITTENVRECRQAGAAGIAAIRLFQQCKEGAEAIRVVTQLKHAWEG